MWTEEEKRGIAEGRVFQKSDETSSQVARTKLRMGRV